MHQLPGIKDQISAGDDAIPLSCSPNKTTGPCDLNDIFPLALTEDIDNGETLTELGFFGRLHGVQKDPSNRYVNANIFTPQGGYIGVMDTKTKAAIGLFRVTKTTGKSALV